MDEITKNKPSVKVGDTRVHLANERTFLSWIRTSIGIMAFGFVVERFAFFIKNISLFLVKPNLVEVDHSSLRYSSVFGIALVAVGALMGVLAFMRYVKVEKEIDEDAYRPSLTLDIIITTGIFASGVFIVIYMIYNL